jgi:SAM-dependent methyltransferase
MSGADSEHWTGVAAEWIAWARAPNHDAFWAYRDALGAFVGAGPGDALDVGCGEGRVSRLLSSRGWRVTAADPVAVFVEAACAADSAHAYVVARADALPFPDASFDLVVAYNMLMDVEDVPAAVREFARLLRPDGVLLVSVVHPFSDRGRFEPDDAPLRFVLDAPYFGRVRFEGSEERDGLTMQFAGWSQPLGAYAAALEAAGLAITALREPLPDTGDGRAHLQRWTRIPLFLWLKAQPLHRAAT